MSACFSLAKKFLKSFLLYVTCVLKFAADEREELFCYVSLSSSAKPTQHTQSGKSKAEFKKFLAKQTVRNSKVEILYKLSLEGASEPPRRGAEDGVEREAFLFLVYTTQLRQKSPLKLDKIP